MVPADGRASTPACGPRMVSDLLTVTPVDSVYTPRATWIVSPAEAKATAAWIAPGDDPVPNAVPAPYNHSNVDSDEVLYYASSEFMSRKGIEFGSITHHPDGIPHGPHPGAYEASIGHKETNELAVMLDCFLPLTPTPAAGSAR